MKSHNHNSRANRHAHVCYFAALVILALLFAPVLAALVGAAPNHEAGTVLAFGPFAFMGGHRVCTGLMLEADKGGGTGGTPADLEATRDKVLKEFGDIREGQKNQATELKTIGEKLAELGGLFTRSQNDQIELGKRMIDLQQRQLAVRAQAETASLFEFYRGSDPETCKAMGAEVVKRANMILRAESGGSGAGAAVVGTPAAALQIYSNILAAGAFRVLDTNTIGTRTGKFLVETSRPKMVFVPENGLIPEGTLGLAPQVAEVGKIAGLIGISGELQADALIDLGAYVLALYTQAAAECVDNMAFMGDGTNVNDANNQNGGVLGIFNAGTIVNAAAGHNAASKVTLADLRATLGGVAPAILGSSSVAARWFSHPTMLTTVLGINDQSGRSVLQPSGAAATNGLDSILGYPITLVPPAPTAAQAEAASQKMLAFGDPKGFAVFIRKEFELTNDNGYSRFEYYQTVYRAIMRVGGKIKSANAFAILRTAAV